MNVWIVNVEAGFTWFLFLPFRENEHVVCTDRPLQVREPSGQWHRRRGHIESVWFKYYILISEMNLLNLLNLSLKVVLEEKIVSAEKHCSPFSHNLGLHPCVEVYFHRWISFGSITTQLGCETEALMSDQTFTHWNLITVCSPALWNSFSFALYMARWFVPTLSKDSKPILWEITERFAR